MKLPKRFETLIESGPGEVPDFCWLAFAVCALGENPCGWSGWILDGVFRSVVGEQARDDSRVSLPSSDSQTCPSCGGTLFRTGHDVRMDRSASQDKRLKLGTDYDLADDVEYA